MDVVRNSPYPELHVGYHGDFSAIFVSLDEVETLRWCVNNKAEYVVIPMVAGIELRAAIPEYVKRRTQELQAL